MSEILRMAGELGGFIGLFSIFVISYILYFYHRDRKASEDRLREDRTFMEDRLDKIILSYNDVVDRNTKALTELTTLVQRLNGH